MEGAVKMFSQMFSSEMYSSHRQKILENQSIGNDRKYEKDCHYSCQ